MPHMREILFSIIVPTFNRIEQLKECLHALLHQTLPASQYEIIIVNDGSNDGTGEYLRSLSLEKNIRTIEIPNSGPTIAKNRGAELARGTILAFTDDDCLVPPDWLERIEQFFATEHPQALGGRAAQRTSGSAIAHTYFLMNDFFYQDSNREEGKARFLTTNNFGCLRNDFQEAKGFDDRFYHGGEDREFTARLIALGKKVVFTPSLIIQHDHPFSLLSYCRHLFMQGKGSYLFYQVSRHEHRYAPPAPSFSLYFKLLSHVWKYSRGIEALIVLLLTLMGQAAAFLGYLTARWDRVTTLLKDSASGKAGVQSERGSSIGMLSFLGGTVVSSFFGFLTFIIIANALSLADYGIFMLAFSIESICSSLARMGLSTSTTRYAAEYSKEGHDHLAATVIKSGFVLQSFIILIIASLLIGIYILIDITAYYPSMTPGLFVCIIAAMTVNSIFDNLTTIFFVYLRFNHLALLRMTVSVTRVLLVFLYSLIFTPTPVMLFFLFMLPAVLGVGIGLVVLLRQIRGRGSVQVSFFSRLLKYGGWQSITHFTTQLTTQSGIFLLTLRSTPTEAGIYGIGLTMSFIFGVIVSTLLSYFMPIGMRIQHDEEIRGFIVRTLRLAAPLALFSGIALFLSEPFIRLFFGEARTLAVPVFILLSLSNIMQIFLLPITVLFHYFFKPGTISIITVSRVLLFMLFGFFLAIYGATSVALVYALVHVFAGIVLTVFLYREFKKRSLKFDSFRWFFSATTTQSRMKQ
ncbi:MAG: glycosyltransferase [bacterium]